MARNGSGTYSNPYPNFVAGTVISSDQVDANNSDIATALTQSIAVDGQAVVTADIPLATHKFTGMKVGTASTDSLSLGQAQAEAFVWCGTAGGGADAITLSPTPAITAYAAGQRFVWMASGSTNTTATTVAISGLTAIALQDNGAALTAGQHAAGKMFIGILNTTSTVQIMQVELAAGTDPLTVASLTVTGDATIGDDLTLLSDASILGFGENTDVTLTHVHDTGLLLNSTRQLQFNDASQYINAPSATVLDINATDEIELNATLADVNANLDVSGTYQGGGTMTTGGNIVIPNAGTIGSVGDASAMTIASGGGVTFSDAPVFPDGSINLADLDIDGGTDIGEAIVDADLMIIDNGAGGTNRKTAASRLKTYIQDAGSVLQVVQNGTVGGLGSTSTSYVDITNATAAITCSSTSSKVLVMWSAQAAYTLVASTNVSGTHKVLRGTTSLGTAVVQVASGSGGLQGIWPMSFSYLDSPSSTDAQTYKVQQLVSSSSSTFTTSTGWLILMEIAG